MGLAIEREHEELTDTLRETLRRMDVRGQARQALDAEADELPRFWAEFAAAGWLGVHLSESLGGAGQGMLDACLVQEALGSVCAPGPALPTMVASAVLADAGGKLAEQLVPFLADGSAVAAVAPNGELRSAGDGTVSGDAGVVPGAVVAQHLVLRVGDDVVVVPTDRAGIRLEPLDSMDHGVRSARVRCDNVAIDDAELLGGQASYLRSVGRLLAAAHAAGGASACQRMSTAYAKIREQFGRPIGAFQAVKHMCADLFVLAESAAAVTWDATRAGDRQRFALASSAAATLALRNYLSCSELNVQVHGGIGFTWEHDAHLHLRRAATLAAVFDAGQTAAAEMTTLVEGGVTRDRDVPLPMSAEQVRSEARAFLDSVRGKTDGEVRHEFEQSGYLMPEWPKPWGRDADALEQYVIKNELRGLPRPVIDVPWVPMTIGQLGTAEQAERLLPGSLDGSVTWCQLSSEPDAGSDAAAVRTRATKIEGGWSVTGQKVWTSHAATATHGLATVRTDPDKPKHAGISMLIIDMSADGITIRPLREIAGGARPSATDFGDTSFNEVFFDEVFVPDENLLGEVNDGWGIVRALLGNERVTIGERTSPVETSDLMVLLAETGDTDAGRRRDVGVALAEEQAVQALNLRRLLRSLSAGPTGPEANVVKILNSERIQRIAALGLRMAGDRGADEGEDFGWLYLRSRFTTIGGGTAEITRNVLAERVLGLPRDR